MTAGKENKSLVKKSEPEKKVKTVDVESLSPGDCFTFEGETYVLDGRDSMFPHVHVRSGNGVRAIDFGTKVTKL